jgi:tripartite ATP-independent transporter DctM subunit
VLIYREIPLRELPGVMRDSMVMVGGILIILGVSMASTNVLIDAEVPAKLFTLIQRYVTDRLAFLMLLNVLLLVLGAILDIFSAIVIMVPLILPVAVSYDVHPLHLGVVFLANMQIGYVTPPVGKNLFIASYRFRRPVTELYRAALPFMLVLLAAVLVITYVPWLTMALVGE